MSNRFTKASLYASTFIAGALIASPALAQDPVGTNAGVQDDDDDLTDQDVALQAAPTNEDGGLIVVTGSRIAQRNVSTAAPIAVVDDEEFALSGTVNVENVINTLPQVVPSFNSNSNNPGDGTARLNLRGLGEQRTLVLVNGRRYISFDTQQITDLNSIPSFLIESVDVVTGGASAVYGSDALAGVVNFRLREVEGVELGGQYALTEEGDGQSYNVHGAIGAQFDDGRGSATVFAEYFNRDAVFQGDRDFSFFAVGGETFGVPLQRFGSSTPPQGRINAPGSALIQPAVDLDGDGEFDGPGETVSLPLGNVGTDADGNDVGTRLIIDDIFFTGPGTGRRRTGADTYNYAPANYLQVPQERYLIGGYADYEFSDGHEFYTEVTFANNRVANELAATPVTGTFNLDLDTIEPFVSDAVFAEFQELDARETAAAAAQQAFNDGLGDCDDPDRSDDRPACFGPLAGAQEGVVSAFVQRRALETGARNVLNERNAFRVLGGVRGEITDWLNYDGYYSYARTRNAIVQQGNISRSAFQAGLDGTGTPINIFGAGTLTDDQIAAISIQAQNADISTVEVASFALSGFLGDVGFDAGDVGFALGVEYRKVGSAFLPDTALSSGDVIGFNAGNATAGDYNVKEVFGELNIPIIDSDSGFRLELTGAGRYSDYSLDAVGGVATYAGGVELAPIPDVVFRAQYQRAIRAPNVGELFGGQAIGFPTATDPCAVSTPDGVDATGLRATCIAAGVPAALVGSADVALNSQIPALFGGNPDLQEETSDSYTFGVVLQPRFLPGFVLTADYYNIKIEDAIATFGGGFQNALNLCFNEVQDINDPICAPFRGTRDASTGSITVDNPPSVLNDNIASLETSGIDLQVSYGIPIPFSLLTTTGEQDLNLSFFGTWTEKADFIPVQGFDTVTSCDGKFGATCQASPFFQPVPEFKWTSRASFIDGPLTTSIRWRYLDSVRDDNEGLDFTAFGGTEVLDAQSYFDLTLAFDVSEQFVINLGVNNIFDNLPEAPTFNADGTVANNDEIRGSLLGDNQEQANTYPSVYDVLGRRYFVSAAFKF